MPAQHLKDVLPPQPRLLLVGINPSLRSGAVGHHFAGNGNPFWRLLYESRLIPVPLAYAEDQRLAEFGIGLTNLCARATRAASELTAAEMAIGRRALARKCRRVRPRLVAFVGISLYQSYFQLPASGGPGEKTQTIAGAPVFVVPNPSGLNASFPGFKDKLAWFQALHAFVERAQTTRGRSTDSCFLSGSERQRRLYSSAREAHPLGPASTGGSARAPRMGE